MTHEEVGTLNFTEITMQIDFHYYATYCAAYIAGFSHEESLTIAYSAQFADCCSRTLLEKAGAPDSAATTQLQLEMMEARTDLIGLQDITRIWSSFHFLPGDLHAKIEKGSRQYKDKYRLICNTNSDLLVETVELAKGKGPQAVGLAMHVLADTWAHRYFAGTPSMVINNTDSFFYELVPVGEVPPEGTEADAGQPDGTVAGAETAGGVEAGATQSDDAEAGAAPPDGFFERKITFKHDPSAKDDIVNGVYVNTIFQIGEDSVMCLGHGRAGHLPDYSFARYKYMPAWNDFEEIIKDNPSDYYNAFCQMIYALKYLREAAVEPAGDAQAAAGQAQDGAQSQGENAPPARTFEKNRYDREAAEPYRERIREILEVRRLDASEDWKALGEELSGQAIPDFDQDTFIEEYKEAQEDAKEETFLGKYIIAAMAQKSMVTNRIYKSGNLLAGYSIDYDKNGFGGIRDFMMLVEYARRGAKR